MENPQVCDHRFFEKRHICFKPDQAKQSSMKSAGAERSMKSARAERSMKSAGAERSMKSAGAERPTNPPEFTHPVAVREIFEAVPYNLYIGSQKHGRQEYDKTGRFKPA